MTWRIQPPLCELIQRSTHKIHFCMSFLKSDKLYNVQNGQCMRVFFFSHRTSDKKHPGIGDFGSKLLAMMDRRGHTDATVGAHFSGTFTTILVDTQHALILNYGDTKPCSARENLPYRQEQHPRLSSRRAFVGDYPLYRDLSTLLPLGHPRKRVKRPFRPFLPLFLDLPCLFCPLSHSEIIPLLLVFFSLSHFCWSSVRSMGKKDLCYDFFFVRLTMSMFPPSYRETSFRIVKIFCGIGINITWLLISYTYISRMPYLRRERVWERRAKNRHSTSHTRYRHFGKNSRQIRVTDTRDLF